MIESMQISLNAKPDATDESKGEIDDVLGQWVEEQVPDELQEASIESINWLLSTGKPITANELYGLLELQESYELWLFAFLNYIHGLPQHERARVNIEYDEEVHPIFNGNRTIKDFKVMISPYEPVQ